MFCRTNEEYDANVISKTKYAISTPKNHEAQDDVNENNSDLRERRHALKHKFNSPLAYTVHDNYDSHVI